MNMLLGQFAAMLSLVGAAMSTTAALRNHQRPSGADLERLGIKEQDFTVRL